MDVLVFCYLIVALIARTDSLQQYYFVTGPNVIRFNHAETLTVSIFGNQRDVTVTVWFELGEKQFSEKRVTVQNEESPKQTTVRVYEGDIFDGAIDEKPRTIKLCSRRSSDIKICRDLVLSYKTGYLFVQTDAPIYTPLERVAVRVLAIDESMKAVASDKQDLTIDIVSPSNHTFGRKVFIEKTSNGFYKTAFGLPTLPETGTWTARCFYIGQYETASRALFQVEKYVLPSFGVSIDVSVPYILKARGVPLTITVNAKYVYGKPVDGNARLTLNITHNMGDSEYLLKTSKKNLVNGIQEFRVTIGDILESRTLKNKEFPDGSRLLVVATVLESATGKEETTNHDKTIFASQPYIFKFTRSKKYFKPGLEYYAQVDMFEANKQPAVDQLIEVLQLDENGKILQNTAVTTNSKGQALAILPQSIRSNTLKFKVIATNAVQESEIVEVRAYGDSNQIQVEHIDMEDPMMIRATTNMQFRSGYTGMLFLVVVRGKVVKTVFKPASNGASERLNQELQEIISPTARVLVFYVDERTNSVVADSVKIEVDPKCRGKGLKLKMTPSGGHVSPGEIEELTVSGTPLMWVGLSAIDTALLPRDENILKKNEMFDALASHDLGCGPGSGKNNGDVFRNAGLTVLTNAKVEPEVDRLSEECDTKKRRKRAADGNSVEVCYGASIKCCNYGIWYAKNVFKKTVTGNEQSRIDSYTRCYAAAVSKRMDNTRTRCLLAVLYSCMDMLNTLKSDITQTVPGTIDSISEFETDLQVLAGYGIRPYKRSDFRTHYMFQEVQLGMDGTVEQIFSLPDSINEWMIQGIGFTENEGICISDSVDVKVFREFFIQLDLPYNATRLERFDVKATLFNYGLVTDKPIQANVYLHGTDGLCYNSAPGLPSIGEYVEIGPNSAQTVRFPVIPLLVGLFPIKVIAVIRNGANPSVDVIEKKFYVVYEGIPEIITIQACLDLSGLREDCESDKRVITRYDIDGTGTMVHMTVDLTLPLSSIPGTGSATAYIRGTSMENDAKTVLSGVESLFPVPTGNGEAIIARTAGNVYPMMYLKQTNQDDAYKEVNGNTNIRRGQLTAFVAKVFCHANAVLDDVIDEQTDLHTTIFFLKNHVNSRGEFIEIRAPLYGSKIMGSLGIGTSPSMTSFVLISLLECGIFMEDIKDTVDLATQYIEKLDVSWLQSNPFDLAISTYALSLTASKKKQTFKTWLHSIERRNGKNKQIYWAKSDIPAGTMADAYSVETTAYALLAMLQFNDLKTSAFIVRWLTSQQNAFGVFRDPQSLAIGLQALTLYSSKADEDMKVSMTSSEWLGTEFLVTSEVQRVVDRLPVERGDNQIIVKVTGGTRMSGDIRFELRYNRPNQTICPFLLSDIEVGEAYRYAIDQTVARERQCDVCGKCAGDPEDVDYDSLTASEFDYIDSASLRRKRQVVGNARDRMKCIRFSVRAENGHQHGMSMVYFHLQTDVTVLEEDLKKLMEGNENLDNYDMPTDVKRFIVFHLNTLTSSHVNNFVFRLDDNFAGDMNNRQPASVEVFDYYNKENYCRKIYGTSLKRGFSFEYTCNAENTECTCIQNICSKPVDNELKKMMTSRRKLAKLIRYTCSPEKANFAVYVSVTDVLPDMDKKITMARANVIKSLLQGRVRYDNGDEMTFYWKTSCAYPKLEVGKRYYIIAKDGHMVAADKAVNEYHYPLMGTALVIENAKGKIERLMTMYTILMLNHGCMS